MRHLYSTHVEIQRLGIDMSTGLPRQVWQKVATIVDPFLGVPGEMMCRLDLSFVRPGKDQPMPVVAGRAPDRVGVMFFSPTTEIRSGDRIVCLDGPTSGTFEIRSLPDVASGYATAHHMEVQVVEVAQSMQTNLLNQTEVGA